MDLRQALAQPPPDQLELWLDEDRDYVPGALGPGGEERLIANLLDQLSAEVAAPAVGLGWPLQTG